MQVFTRITLANQEYYDKEYFKGQAPTPTPKKKRTKRIHFVCEGCGIPYFKEPNQKNVKFCSSECSKSFHNRKYYQANKEELKANQSAGLDQADDAIIESW